MLLCILFNTALYSQSGWQQQNSGTSSTLLGAATSGQNTAYVCGINGIVLKSTNSGSNWFSLSTGTNRFLRSISSADPDIIYAAGELGIILKSTNGGVNWLT